MVAHDAILVLGLMAYAVWYSGNCSAKTEMADDGSVGGSREVAVAEYPDDVVTPAAVVMKHAEKELKQVKAVTDMKEMKAVQEVSEIKETKAVQEVSEIKEMKVAKEVTEIKDMKRVKEISKEKKAKPRMHIPNMMPNSFFEKLNKLMSINAIVKSLNNGTMPKKKALPTSVQHNIITGDEVSIEYLTPLPSACVPMLKPVKLKARSKNTFYEPRCINVMRCGGCCRGNNMKCQPVKSRVDIFNIYEVEYNKDSQEIKDVVKVSKAVTIHELCDCMCSVTSEDCNDLQDYFVDYCMCQCKDIATCPRKKKWNNRLCNCECRRKRKCRPSRYFDKHTCTCNLIRRKRKSHRNH